MPMLKTGLLETVVDYCLTTGIGGLVNITGFLVFLDIEKAFASLKHSFLNSILKKSAFGKRYHFDRNFINRSTIVL